MSQENIKVEGESKKKLETHAEIYRTPKKVDVKVREFSTSMGDSKTKYIRSKTFSNGVVKNELCGLKKNNRMIFGTDK